MLIPPEIIEEIRTSADIVDIVSGYVSMKRRGQNYFGICPFHSEKTASFSVNPQKQIFHCFGCGEGGNVVSFIMKIENLSFAEAVRFLADKLNIKIPETKITDEHEKERLALYDVNRFATNLFKENLWGDSGKEARAYLRQRQFSDEVLQRFEIGFALAGWDHLIKAALKFGFSMEQLKTVGLVIPNNSGGYYDRFRQRIVFPIHNLSGLIVGFGARIFKDQPDAPKYLNSPETAIYQKSRILYGLFQHRESIRKQESALLVEGYADVLGLSQADIQNAVASSGTALTTEKSRLLMRYTPKTTILYDGDLAGANAALRGVDILLQEGMQVKVAVLPEGSDPDSFVKEQGAAALQQLLTDARELIDFKIFAFSAGKPLQSTQQQAELVHILAETLAKIQDEVTRNLYIQEIARRLKLSETVIFRAVAKSKRTNRPEEPSPTAKEIVHSARFRAEQDLLEIALRFSQMVPVIYQNLELDEIKSEPHRQAIGEIYNQFVNTGRVNSQHVLDTVTDAELQKFIVKMMIKETESTEETLRQWTSDCIKAIKMANLQKEIDQIREAIRAGEEDKNAKAVHKLSKSWTQLQQQIANLKAKKFFLGDEV